MGRRRYTVDDTYFDKIDTQDKAYYFGLLYADGCNYEDSGLIKIDLIEKDVELLQTFANDIKYTGEIKHYYTDIEKIFSDDDRVYKCQPMTRLSFRSKRISEQLAIKGCVSNKSAIGLFPKEDIIPNDLLRHFIRGYMDGNGGSSFWIDNKNTGHKKFQIHCCGTTDIINNLSDIFKCKFNCKPATTKRFEDRDNNNLQLCIDGNKVVCKILDWLYSDATVYMQRKYEKYIILLDEIKRVENDTNLYGNAYKRRPVINLETKEIYSGVNNAGKTFGVSGSTILSWCRKHQRVMYLDEYEAS